VTGTKTETVGTLLLSVGKLPILVKTTVHLHLNQAWNAKTAGDTVTMISNGLTHVVMLVLISTKNLKTIHGMNAWIATKILVKKNVTVTVKNAGMVVLLVGTLKDVGLMLNANGKTRNVGKPIAIAGKLLNHVLMLVLHSLIHLKDVKTAG